MPGVVGGFKEAEGLVGLGCLGEVKGSGVGGGEICGDVREFSGFRSLGDLEFRV